MGDCWSRCGYWWDESKCCIFCAAIVVGAVVFAVLLAAYGFIIHVRIAVDDASLTRFELVETTSPATLEYSLALTLTIRNPNWAMTIKNSDKLMAEYSFDRQFLDRVLVADEGVRQGPRKTRVYHLAAGSNGTAVSKVGSEGIGEFRKQNATGFFAVEVKLTGKFSYTARLTKCDLDATCPLKLQLAPPGTKATVFHKVKCTLEKPKKNC